MVAGTSNLPLAPEGRHTCRSYGARAQPGSGLPTFGSYGAGPQRFDMSLTVYLSGHLKSFTDGETEIALASDFDSVSAVLDSLWKKHPALRDRVLNEQGEIRQHVNIFADGRDVKRFDGLATKLTDGEIHIFNAVSGG